MKKFKEKLLKIKFLIPPFVGGFLIFWVKDQDAVDGRSRMTMIVGILLISIYLTIHHFRIAFDKNYKEKCDRIILDEIKKPWYSKTKTIGITVGICIYYLLKHF